MPRLGGVGQPTPSLRNNDNDSGARLFVVLVILSLVIFTLGAREGESGFFVSARQGFMTITTPIRFIGSAVAMPFQGLGNIFTNLTADQETLSDLKAKNEELSAKNAQLEEDAQAASRLQKLLNLQDTYELKSTAARIISASVDSWSRSVVIDKGTASGLGVGMPVTDSSGVIGQITECGPSSSTVRLISDENSAVSAMVQSSRAQGVLKGSADGTLYLTLIATDQTVSVGDNVVTSGLGGVYPKGLPLGKVLSVSKNDGDLYYTIVVEPVATFSNFEEVLVITSLTTGQEATADDISDADGQDSAQVSGASSDSEDSDSDAEDSDSSDGSGSDSDSGSSSDSDDSSDSSSKKNSKSSNSSSDSDSSDSDDSSSSSSSDSSKKEQNSTSSSSKKSNGSDDSDSTSSSGSSSD